MKLRLISAGILLFMAWSCRENNVEPAQSIQGTYKAIDYNHFSQFSTPYPINGQTLTLSVNYVSADTVSVTITPSDTTKALPSGVYAPNRTLSYPKAFVETLDNSATYIYLTGKPKSPNSTADNQIWIYKDRQTADYIFTPKQTPTISTAIRFEKN